MTLCSDTPPHRGSCTPLWQVLPGNAADMLHIMPASHCNLLSQWQNMHALGHRIWLTLQHLSPSAASLGSHGDTCCLPGVPF